MGARTQLMKTTVDGLFGNSGLANVDNVIAFSVTPSKFLNQFFSVRKLSLQPKDQRTPVT